MVSPQNCNFAPEATCPGKQVRVLGLWLHSEDPCLPKQVGVFYARRSRRDEPWEKRIHLNKNLVIPYTVVSCNRGSSNNCKRFRRGSKCVREN